MVLTFSWIFISGEDPSTKNMVIASLKSPNRSLVRVFAITKNKFALAAFTTIAFVPLN